MITFDLHLHSKYSSDGELSIPELLDKALAAGLTTIALSDHNTANGVDELCVLGSAKGIRVIPAIEFDTLFEGLEVHVLGYGLHHHQPYFDTLQDQLMEKKQTSMKQRIDKLNAHYGMDLDVDELLETFGTKNPFPGIVETFLNDPRYCDKPDFQPYRPGGARCEPACVNFYWDNCSAGTPCYVHVDYPSLEETVRIIHEAGGIAIIAHPFRNFYHKEDLLRKAVDQGIDGIEAYSNYHDSDQNHYYAQYCQQHNLLMTCGSDFHGKMKPKIQMGEFGYEGNESEAILESFLQRIDV